MQKQQAEAELGPNVAYREYSLLQNNMTPEAVRRDIASVLPCQVHIRVCTAEIFSQVVPIFPRSAYESPVWMLRTEELGCLSLKG